MLISLELLVDGFRPLTQANSFVLAEGDTAQITIQLTPGQEPLFTDACPGLRSTAQDELSAAGQEQAALCARLPNTGTGMSGPGASRLPALVLALFGALAAGAGVALRFRRRVAA